MKRFQLTAGMVLAMTAAAPLAAADLAFVVVNGEYGAEPDIRVRGLSETIEGALEDAGFRVFAGRDATGPGMQKLAAEFAQAVEEGGDNRIVVVLSGHMAQGAGGPWLLGTEAEAPDAFGVGGVALPVAPLAQIAATAPGQAVVMIADTPGNAELGRGLLAEVQAITAPQGVTLVQGPVSDLADLLSDAVLVPGMSYSGLSGEAGRAVRLGGFVSPVTGLLPGADQAMAPAPAPAPAPDPQVDTGELAYWNAAQDMGTADALQSYLNRYPEGQFAGDARRMIEDLKQAPLRQAQAGEEALSLSRDQRRTVQRNLSLVGFDPKGIDGIFGPGSRAAIGQWQGANNFEATTYLTGPQVDRLQEQAAIETQKLEEQARQRREAEEAADRAYWQDVGQGQDEAALRAYLKRYPEGQFADVANERLAAIEAEKRQQTQGAEMQAWDQAQAQDQVAAYQQFLEAYPQSGFAEAAQARIQQLQQEQQNAAAMQAAEQEEARIAGNQVTRLLAEKRLQQLGYDIGAADGALDEAARRGIRRFQREQGIPETGFITQDTMVRLLAF
ncbi:hypothetical protein GLS40_14240 [Pseudooceanicola sp. 216_PA32_1]|uniref:Peptidoglycan binding-like domain-containing protein n=1 Tax=Pseudooceanicola pacificus TaxID=2676438 RepID=A0A844W4M2_9RHOB|nr:peptidoglycan-binding protein [Pseudooceanicola pacificus]MWB79196.1 hypothetical protein [Pseudooceanicola pacificus]